MANDSFILVNLKESESKKLAQVISNDSSRKILDYLSENKDGTASDIAKALGIPLSTAHYNLKALLKARLIQVDEFHYSPKGKEVDHYKLSNKFVVIAPTAAPESLLQKLGKILPVATVVAVGSGIVYYVERMFTGSMGVMSASRDYAIPAFACVGRCFYPDKFRSFRISGCGCSNQGRSNAAHFRPDGRSNYKSA